MLGRYPSLRPATPLLDDSTSRADYGVGRTPSSTSTERLTEPRRNSISTRRPGRRSSIARGHALGVAHAPAGHREDHVAVAQAGLGGGRALDHLDHQRARAARRVGGAHAQVCAPHLAAAHELARDPPQRVDRDGEGQPVAAALGDHPDHAALAVQQRAAGVARVDRGVGLDRVADA